MEVRPWTKWDRFDWNERLIDHFFLAADRETSEPVHRLDVSWQTLVAIAGDREASQDVVKGVFLERIKKALGSASLLSHAENDGSRLYNGRPSNFIHLFITCLAAAEVQEDKEHHGSIERNFRDAVCTLLGDRIHDGNLSALPELWTSFARWTADQAELGSYRKLVLPDPGAENLIGYSKKLVFPKVRDQGKLAELLQRVDLLMEDPPVEFLKTRLRTHRAKMPNEIGEAFDEFCKIADLPIDWSTLADHRFMLAVNAVAKNPDLFADTGSSRGDLSVLLFDYVDSVELVFATSDDAHNANAEVIRDELLPSGWPFRIVSIKESPDVATHFLNQSTVSPLTWLVRPGVVPFGRSEDGFIEPLQRGHLEDATHVLVRNDRLESLCRLYSIEKRKISDSVVEGWSLVYQPRLQQLEAAVLSNAGLADVTVLQPRPIRHTLGFRDGFGVSGEFLGFAETLPWISAPGAVSVVALLDGVDVPLSKSGDRWTLSGGDLFGLLEVVAVFPGDKLMRKVISLVAEPIGLDYKVPSRPNDWMQETLAGTTMYLEASSSNLMDNEVDIPDAVHRLYLGPVVGEFLPTDEGAAFELVRFGRMKSARVLNGNLNLTPVARVENKGMCRRWRESLEEYCRLDVNADEASRQAMQRAKAIVDLAKLKIGGAENAHRPPSTSFPPADRGCRVLQAAMGSYCTRRAGMQLRDWNRLLDSAFSCSAELRRLIHRAWIEAGLVDELKLTKWQGVAVYARRPSLCTFRVGQDHYGSVDGLVMPTRLAALDGLAQNLGLDTSLNNSPSKFVPARLMVRSSDRNSLVSFASASGLEVHHLGSSPSLDMARRDVEYPKMRVGYVARKSFPTFSPPEGVSLVMHQRADSPSFWSANAGSSLIWSYSPEAVSFWVRRALGLQVAEVGQGSEIEVNGSFLPLSVSQWLALVSGTNPGPRADGSYVNPAPSRQLAERIVSLIHQLTTPQLSPGARDD